MNKKDQKTGRFISGKVKFTTQKEEGSFPGGGRWEIIREGQEFPRNGDQVQVIGKIFLPGVVQGYLIDSLCFGNRVSILNDCLGYGNWGKPHVDSLERYHSFFSKAPTWKEAFQSARKIITDEAVRLQTAIDAREQALTDADY